MQNVSPTHAPDIVIYLDAITVIFEEASKNGPPLSLPIACIEAGNDQGLPNLPLRLIRYFVVTKHYFRHLTNGYRFQSNHVL